MYSTLVTCLVTFNCGLVTAQSCPQHFSHLASKLFVCCKDADLKKMRDMLITVKPADTKQQVTSQMGQCRQQIAILYAQQAAQSQQALPVAEECVKVSAAKQIPLKPRPEAQKQYVDAYDPACDRARVGSVARIVQTVFEG